MSYGNPLRILYFSQPQAGCNSSSLSHYSLLGMSPLLGRPQLPGRPNNRTPYLPQRRLHRVGRHPRCEGLHRLDRGPVDRLQRRQSRRRPNAATLCDVRFGRGRCE